MFKLIRFIIAIVILALAAYMVFFVPVGSLTLWGHLSAIWSTEEARNMRDDIKSSVGHVSDEISERNAEKAPEKEKPVSSDRITDSDRRNLKKLIKSKSGGGDRADENRR